MTISMYKTSVPILVQFLTSMSAVLDKAAAHCEAKKIEPAAPSGRQNITQARPTTAPDGAPSSNARATVCRSGIKPALAGHLS